MHNARSKLRATLSRPDDELRNRFARLSSARDLAEILEIPYSCLVFFAIKNKASNYKKFEIPKRTGGTRLITAPHSSLKIIQRKLCYILNLMYVPKPSTHGFVKSRNIVTNADYHTDKNLILNIDLENFFPSINFGRVRGVFLKPPFNLPAEVSTYIALICCHEGTLPQGAPTSPIISNLVCRPLDGQLQSFAGKRNCTYTRYADDITFSANQSRFSSSIVKEENIDGKSVLTLGEELLSIINGVKKDNFSINYKKLRLKRKSQRQEVTGLIVNNDAPNVNRNLIRQIRAMFHAWKKFGLEKAAEEHFNRYKRVRLATSKHSTPESRNQIFKQIIYGKLMFIRYVRGEGFEPYRKFIMEFRRRDPEYKLPPLPDLKEQTISPVAANLKDYLWVISPRDLTENATAFMLDGIGLVTNEHCIFEDCVAYRPHFLKEAVKPYSVKAVWKSDDYDLAILRFADENDDQELTKRGLKPRLGRVKQSEKIYVCGYPTFAVGDPPALSQGHVMTGKTRRGRYRYIVSARIDSGMSGCPMVNRTGDVLGVAATGAQSYRQGKSADDIRTSVDGIVKSYAGEEFRHEELANELTGVLVTNFELKRTGEHPDHTYEHGVIPIDDLFKNIPDSIRTKHVK